MNSDKFKELIDEFESEINPNVDKFLFHLMGEQKIHLQVPHVKKEDIVAGSRFFAELNPLMALGTRVEEIEITYVRSGIAFFIEVNNPETPEDSFPLNCLFADKLLEYKEYRVPDKYSPDYYQFVSRFGKTSIIL